MKADLLIEGGRLLDPAAGIDMYGAVAVKDGKILSLHPMGDGIQAKTRICAEGCCVVPGFIDVHTHINYLNQANGMPVDIAGIPSGVTAAADAGSTGVSNYKGLLRNLELCETKTKIMLNVSAGGIIMPTQYPEPINPDYWDTELFEEAFRHSDEIIGLKIRISRNITGDMGLKPLEKAVELARRLHTRLIVHPTDPPASMEEIAELLGPGDILTHVYHGEGHSILADNGSILPGIRRARERGVLFDCANGKANTDLSVAKAALREGFFPDTISTDHTLTSWNHPLVHNLPVVLSKYMALGLSLEQVLECTTANAAAQMGMEGEWGTLREGTSADITLLKVQEKKVQFTDKNGSFICGDTLLVPHGTIIDGKLLYLSTEMFGTVSIPG